MTTPLASGQGRTRWLYLCVALLLLFVILLLPDHPQEIVPAAFLRLPLEWPLAMLALLLAPRRIARAIRWLIVLTIGTLLLLRLADLGSYLAFDRRFSPLVELHLIGDGWNLASQAVGRLEAAFAFIIVLLLFVLLCATTSRGLAEVSKLPARPRRRLAGFALLLLSVGGLGLALTVSREATSLPVQADLASDIVDRVSYMQRSIVDQRNFVGELAVDVLADTPPTFAALSGRDIALIFVESYGRSFIDGERFREPARARLATLDEVLNSAGLQVRSAWLTSPIRGGRSWLAHATFASGLRIDNQARFDRLVASPRTSLNRLFSDAGWRTTGIMPAIREDWPEGSWYGFDEILDVHALGYAGQPFGWVTMPDQYTLSAYQSRVRRANAEPTMTEIALITSHAPWTPLPTRVPWEALDDGSLFDGSHRFGGTAAEVWAEREQVREHYALSLDYSLEVLGEYLARFHRDDGPDDADDNGRGKGLLAIVLGDHQPSSIVNGWDSTADVPIHVISDDPALLARLPDESWTNGMLPADDLPSQSMASMRELLSRRFETTPLALQANP